MDRVNNIPLGSDKIMFKAITVQTTLFWTKWGEPLTDIATGILVVVALAILLNRDRFGIDSLQSWSVTYGAF